MLLFIYSFIHSCVHSFICLFIHSSMHPCMSKYIYIYIIYIHMHFDALPCISMHIQASTHIHAYSCIHTRIHTCIHASCIDASMHPCILASMHPSIHPSIHPHTAWLAGIIADGRLGRGEGHLYCRANMVMQWCSRHTSHYESVLTEVSTEVSGDEICETEAGNICVRRVKQL